MTPAEIDGWVRARRAEVDAVLDARLPAARPGEDPGRLIEAMRYSLLAPGKRLRPILALAAAEAVGGALDEATRVAAASVELVHCYSLIHDDLPAMDDDDMRRGRPTSHKAFGEATAILAGDALLTLAFAWLAEAGAARPRDYIVAIAALARGAGMSGMVRGQARDLGEPKPATLAAVEGLHREKTGALFRAALEIGGAAGGGTPAQLECLRRFGDAYGVAFQHADDLDDRDFPELAAQARARMRALLAEAEAALAGFDGRADPLRALARALAAKE